MDTTGYFPQLGNTDPLYEIADYTQLLKQQLVVKTGSCILKSGNSAFAATVTQVTRQGIMVHINGRVTRSAQTLVLDIPAGYRPSRPSFFAAVLGGNHVLVQIGTDGLLSTPFSSAAGDLMLDLTFVCAASPLP